MNTSGISRSSAALSPNMNYSGNPTPVVPKENKATMNDLIASMNSLTAATTTKMAELNVQQAKDNTDAAKKLSDADVQKTLKETAKLIKKQKRKRIFNIFKKIFKAVMTVASVVSGAGLAIKAVKTVAKMGIKLALKHLGKAAFGQLKNTLKNALSSVKNMFTHAKLGFQGLKQAFQSLRSGGVFKSLNPAKLVKNYLSKIQTQITRITNRIKDFKFSRIHKPDLSAMRDHNPLSILGKNPGAVSKVDGKVLSEIEKSAMQKARIAKMNRLAVKAGEYSEASNQLSTGINNIQTAKIDAQIASIKLVKSLLKTNIEYLNHEKDSRISDIKDLNDIKAQSARIVSDAISKAASLSSKIAHAV